MTEQTQSCIKTRCTVDKAHVIRWLLTMFPEIAHDAVFDTVQDNYSGALVFTVEHTKQEAKPVGPILLSDPNGEVQDA